MPPRGGAFYVAAMDLETLRAEYPILGRTTYLNSCSLGALSRRAESYIDRFHDEWHSLGASAWYELWLGRLATVSRDFH